MRYVHEVNFDKAWEELEEKLNQLYDDLEWEYSTAEDRNSQEEAHYKRVMCGEILDLMDKIYSEN